MKKTAFLIFSVLCIIAIASIAFSADKGSKINMFAGQVVSVDAANKTITLKEDTKGNFTSPFNDKTKVFQNKQSKTISDIKVGDIAAVVFDEAAGKSIAKSITIFASAQESPKK